MKLVPKVISLIFDELNFTKPKEIKAENFFPHYSFYTTICFTGGVGEYTAKIDFYDPDGESIIEVPETSAKLKTRRLIINWNLTMGFKKSGEYKAVVKINEEKFTLPLYVIFEGND